MSKKLKQVRFKKEVQMIHFPFYRFYYSPGQDPFAKEAENVFNHFRKFYKTGKNVTLEYSLVFREGDNQVWRHQLTAYKMK